MGGSMRRIVWLLAFWAMALGACATSSGTTSEPGLLPAPRRVAGDGTRARPYELCLGRTDYPFVASLECADGSRPLNGDWRAGADARVGNVGEGASGHIIDHYRLPCPEGPRDVYVDAYHCAGLPPLAQDRFFANLAAALEAAETRPFDPELRQLRHRAPLILVGNPALKVTECPEVIGGLTRLDSPWSPLLVSQLTAGVIAATIRRSNEPEDRLAVYDRALLGVLRLYRAIVAQRGAAHRIAGLESMIADSRGLKHWLRPRMRSCHVIGEEVFLMRPGLAMTRRDDGSNLWPPRGEHCGPVVACCERHGYIVEGYSTGSAGALCLMVANGAEECAEGMTLLQNVCPPPPPGGW